MFTSEPSLAQRIERMIGDTPIIDPYSHLSVDQPNAPDLATLISDPGVRTELIAVGMPRTDFEASLPADERVRRSIPYLKRTRNTSTSWSLFRIFRDLYDFGDPELSESNYRDLFDKVAQTGQDPDWARSVLHDRSNIQTVITDLGNRSDDHSRNPDAFYYRLDANPLICPGAEIAHKSHAPKTEYFKTLTAILGETPTTTEKLERLVADWLDRTFVDRVRLTSAFLPIEHRFDPPDDAYARSVLDQAADDRELSDPEIDGLARFVSWSILRWHHANRKVIQLGVGTEPAVGGPIHFPRSQENWTREMARGFHHFGNARFDLMIGSETLSQDEAILAREFPNVSISGDWSHQFFPSLIEMNVGLRVQIVPATKISGFVSDASTVEWTYGKVQVVRKAMAAALAGLVEARFFEEDEIPPLLRQILHDTPRDLYGLREV